MPETLTSPQLIAPASARGAAAGGTKLAAGTWAELIDDVGAADVVITGVSGEIGFNPGYLVQLWAQFEIGIGAIGFEIPITTFGVLTTGSASQWQPWVFPEPLDLVPAGSRLSIRMLGTNANNWSDGHYGSQSPRFTVHYVAKPLTGTKSLTSTLIKPYPYAANAVITTVPTAGAFESGFVTALASTPDDMKLVGVTLQGQQSRMEVDVAVGAAGLETVIATIGMYGAPTQYANGPHMLPNAITGQIPVGSRVSMRCRLEVATVTTALRIGYVLLAPEDA